MFQQQSPSGLRRAGLRRAGLRRAGLGWTVCLLASLAISGCARWHWPEEGLDGFFADDEPATSGDAESSDASTVDDRAVLAQGHDEQGRSVWIRATGNSTDYRWRYPNLEDLLSRPAGRRPRFQKFVNDKDSILATNAAIALARLGNSAGAERLADTVRSPKVNLPLRCAAVEALGHLEPSVSVTPLRELIDHYGNQAGGGPLYNAMLHAELIQSLARHVDPANDGRFLDAAVSRSPRVRLAAARAWARTRGKLPADVINLTEDPDARIRAVALRALAKLQSPQAHDRVAAALRDPEMKVRTAAVAALGTLGDKRALATLEELLDNANERIRATAVSAIAQAGNVGAALEKADDKQWRVRLQVAKALAANSDRQAIAVANKLLQDPSTQVQGQVVESLAAWPTKKAGPLLLEALASRSMATRKPAAERLAAKWSEAANFPVEGSPQRRSDTLEALRGKFQQEFGLLDPTALSHVAKAPSTKATEAELDRIEQLLNRQDTAALAAMGPKLLGALEQIVLQRRQVLPESVYQRVLPPLEPAFDALERLKSEDLRQRRLAAEELVQLSEKRSLGPLAAARLAELVTAESDQLIWQSVLKVVEHDGSEPALRLAYAGLSHPRPEVRRQACRHLAVHPDPRHAKVLLPALQDKNETVVIAAVRALARGGRLKDTTPLQRLLAERNEFLRLEAAVALLLLGDNQGAAELTRLAHSGDPKTALKAAEAMGDLADRRFLPELIRMLDSPASVRRAALAALPKVVGRDMGQSDNASTGTTERIRRWKQWYQQQAAEVSSGQTTR